MNTTTVLKDILNGDLAEAKEKIQQILYAKSQLALDERKLELSKPLFNEAPDDSEGEDEENFTLTK